MDYTSLGCCALAFVLYLNTLNSGFVYDDRYVKEINKNLFAVGYESIPHPHLHQESFGRISENDLYIQREWETLFVIVSTKYANTNKHKSNQI